MITLAPIDYVLVGIIFVAVVLRIVGDIRDVLAAKVLKNTMKAIVRRKFSPRLTVIVPLTSLENVKATLEHLQESNLSVNAVVAVDTNLYARDVSALRYFVCKQGYKRTKVTARKTLNMRAIAGEYAKTGLVVVLSDTARLHDSFYEEAIVPFGEANVDAVRLVSSIRSNGTLHSGVEVLFAAWRRYVSLNGLRGEQPVTLESLPEGVVVRAKLTRRLPKKPLTTMATRRALYSVAAQPSAGLMARKVQDTMGAAEWCAVATVAVVAPLLADAPNGSFALGVCGALYAVFAWWSLATAQLPATDRVAVLLLAPLYAPIALYLLVVKTFRRGVRSLKTLGKTSTAPTA